MGDIRKLMQVDILWKGNHITCMKKFWTFNCGLCMKERPFILNAMRKDDFMNKNLLINNSNELYGACRHRTRFHRFMKNITPTPSTDEGHSSPEKSDAEITGKIPKRSRRLPLGTICANVAICAKSLAKNPIILTEDV